MGNSISAWEKTVLVRNPDAQVEVVHLVVQKAGFLEYKSQVQIPFLSKQTPWN